MMMVAESLPVPKGFASVEREGALLVARQDVLEPLVRAGVLDPESLAARAPAVHRGRGALGIVELERGRAVVRPYRRGGLIGKLVGSTFLDAGRSRAELVLHAEAAARGAPVLEVLAAVTRRNGIGWRHGLVTREVTGARDLATILLDARGRERRAAIAAAGHAVRKLHDAGLDHADLNVKNVLFAGQDALVIDLDKGTLGPGPLADTARRRNLVRLLRSFVKLSIASGSTSPRDPLRFARAYARGDRALRKQLVADGRAARPWIALRAFFWRLFGVTRAVKR
jgi:3-deoxy-D-manno-octulosonic acid kinase